jgi:1-acyl-sn-glycerol-3-phosphate acyltransferase
LQAGVSVLVFPEGTTGWGDVVQPFKTGAFQAVAGRDGGAVLPLFLDVAALDGEPVERAQGRRMISHNNQGFVAHCLYMLSLNRAEMEVHVGEPVRAAGRSRKELARLTHRAVSALGGLNQIEADAAQEPAPKIATDAG